MNTNYNEVEDFMNFLRLQNKLIMLSEQLERNNKLHHQLMEKFIPIRNSIINSEDVNPDDIRDFKIKYNVYIECLKEYGEIIKKLETK